MIVVIAAKTVNVGVAVRSFTQDAILVIESSADVDQTVSDRDAVMRTRDRERRTGPPRVACLGVTQAAKKVNNASL